MKIYVITVEPSSGLGTPLKGDTFFGHFCWQVAYDPTLANGGLDKCLEVYDEKPFVIFSSAFPTWKSPEGAVRYAVKRPDLPLSTLLAMEQLTRAERIARRKEFKKKRWMLIGDTLAVHLPEAEYVDDTELFQRVTASGTFSGTRWSLSFGEGQYANSFAQYHNSINRLTNTTGSAAFAPYEQERS